MPTRGKAKTKFLMYDYRSNLIIGFHGCDRQSATSIINHPDVIKKSNQPFDWLGHGMYFWENNKARALQWAIERQKRKGRDIADAAVIGAVIQLGYCCDLMDSEFTEILKDHYSLMAAAYDKLFIPLPVNSDISSDKHRNRLLRKLDCTAIEYMHSRFEKKYKLDILTKGCSQKKIFDSVRGVFIEGGPIYTGAEIYEKTHIQICIRNPNCIRGLFIPRKEVAFLPA